MQAVHVGQLEIGQHQVGAVDDFEALLGGGGLVHLEPRGNQLQLDYAPELLFVFDNQNAFFHVVKKTGWQAKAPAPQGWKSFDSIVGQTLSSVNPTVRPIVYIF